MLLCAVCCVCACWLPHARVCTARYRPLYVDLGDFELAAGLQLWIRTESKGRDASTILLHEQLASQKYGKLRVAVLSNSAAVPLCQRASLATDWFA